MGKVMSVMSRKVKRFNVENRAHRVLEREKPEPAPKFESNLRDLERSIELDPQIVQKLNKKDSSLNDRLRNVYVTSEDSFIDYGQIRRKAEAEKPLPLSRTTPEDFEYGFLEPQRITRGRFTLRQAIKFITDHQMEPEHWTKERIASDYKLKEELVDKILLYYKSFSVYIPDKGLRESILTQMKPKLLKDREEPPVQNV